jgi:molybdopterin-binding protein
LWFDNHGQRILAGYGFSASTLSGQETEFPMKISARNQLKGTIIDVVKGATTSHIRIDIGGGVIVTSSITNEAVDELKLAKGKAAIAVIKASDVMVGTE